MDAITEFAEHVAARGYDDLPAAAIAAAKTFLLDTLGVGLIGSSGPKARELVGIQPLWGSGSDARVWSTGERLPAPAAAFCNAYQIHNAEFDCVHEAAVAHVMTIVLPVALAGAERMAKVEGKAVDGRRLIEAVVLGVDVAASLGLAATSGLRFFRPATVGVFGGAAALGKLMGFDAGRLQHAFAIAYGQLSGNMQAHTEGSLLLAMQMGFSARNAVVACDLANAGFEGPANILEGPFGYFKLAYHGGRAQTVPVGPRHARHCRRLPRAEAQARLYGVRDRSRQSPRAAARAPSRGPSAQEPDADQLRAAVCFICRGLRLPARDGRLPRL
jgi:aconitate decarboxylase